MASQSQAESRALKTKETKIAKASPSQAKIEQMEIAVARVKAGEPLRRVALEMSIARSTLQDKLKGRTPIYWYKHELSPEEEMSLVKWVLACADRGFGRRKDPLCLQVKKILDSMGRQTRFVNNLPGIIG